MHSLASLLKFTVSFGNSTGSICNPNRIGYAQQAASILNACPDAELRNKQEVTLIWFDTEFVIDNTDKQQLTQRLHSLNNYLLFYSNVDCLKAYLQTCQNEKIILVIVQRSTIPPLSIENNDTHIKVFFLSTFDEFESLYNDIDHYISKTFENQRTSGQLIIDSALNVSQRDVRNESFRILCYRMYKQILLEMKTSSNQDAKCELVTLCRNRYQTEFTNDINEFERSYESSDAIKWYTRDTFIYRLVNRALRTQDLQCLLVLRFYLYDLAQCLLNDWKMRRNLTDPGTVIILYRGQIVQHNIRHELEQNRGKIVSINGYWSTSRSELVAKIFGAVGSPLAEADGVSILFEIHVDLHASNNIIADISQFSQIPDEQEVLFDLDTTLIIESVIEEKENDISYWRIRMTVAKDSGMACILRSIEQRRLYDSTGFDTSWSAKPDINPFDSLLQLNNQLHYLYRLELAILELPKTIEVKENDAVLLHYMTGAKLTLSVGPRPELNIDEQKNLCQALMYFTLSAHLLSLDSRYELLLWSQRAIGLLHLKMREYTHALEQLTRIMNSNDEIDPFHTVVCCFCLGHLYSNLKEHKHATEFFEKALSHTADLPPIFEAQCRMQIGHSIELQGFGITNCYPLARANYEKALDLYENRIEPRDDHALALCYAIVGNCHFFERAFTHDANRYYLKAINIYDMIFQTQAAPSVLDQARLVLVGILFNIALTDYQKLSLVEEAKKSFEHIVTYPTEHCPFDSFGLSHRYLGQISYTYDVEYQTALEHFKASANFYQTHSPNNIWELALSNKWLAMTYFKLNAYQLSADHAHRAIGLFLESQSSVSSTNTLVGNDLSYLTRVTAFQQKDETTSDKQTKNQALSETYRLMGDVYEQMHEMDLSLAMYVCALEINQDFTPIYQLETVMTEHRLGDLFMKTDQVDEACTHYRNALNRLKHLYTHVDG